MAPASDSYKRRFKVDWLVTMQLYSINSIYFQVWSYWAWRRGLVDRALGSWLKDRAVEGSSPRLDEVVSSSWFLLLLLPMPVGTWICVYDCVRESCKKLQKNPSGAICEDISASNGKKSFPLLWSKTSLRSSSSLKLKRISILNVSASISSLTGRAWVD